MSIFSNNRILINGLLNSYSIMRMDTLAENLFVETVKNNIEISNQIFTSMIKCYYRCDKIDKAWELYGMRYLHLPQEDDMLINTMINICAATHDAEKAKNLWDKLLLKGFFIIYFFNCRFSIKFFSLWIHY